MEMYIHICVYIYIFIYIFSKIGTTKQKKVSPQPYRTNRPISTYEREVDCFEREPRRRLATDHLQWDQFQDGLQI